MSVRSTADAGPPSIPDPLARQAFVGNVHRLFALGYARLEAGQYSTANENLLTQVVVKALRDATQDVASPEWAGYFTIHEKQRQDDDELEGNSRLELDIVFERTGRGKHPIFKVEAKRLGPRHPVEMYLGSEGLGAFICCEYAEDQDDGGMLGYVQSESVDTWSDSLSRELGVSPGNYSVTEDGIWQLIAFMDAPTTNYRTRHTRTGNRGIITMYHTLLDFCAAPTAANGA